jgi:hypothetical protein
VIVAVLGRLLAAYAIWRADFPAYLFDVVRGRMVDMHTERILLQMPEDMRGEFVQEMARNVAATLADIQLYGVAFLGPEGRIDPRSVQSVG